jgi:hypothetical protein
MTCEPCFKVTDRRTSVGAVGEFSGAKSPGFEDLFVQIAFARNVKGRHLPVSHGIERLQSDAEFFALTWTYPSFDTDFGKFSAPDGVWYCINPD